MIHVGIAISSRAGRMAVSDGGDYRIVECDPAAVPDMVNGVPRLESIVRASSQAEWAAVEAAHALLFAFHRGQLPEVPAAKAVVAVPSYFGDRASQTMTACAVTAGFRSAQSLAEPTAALLGHLVRRPASRDHVVATVVVRLMSVDVGIFTVENGRILPVALAGEPGPLTGPGLMKSVMRTCLSRAEQYKVERVVIAGPRATDGVVLDDVRALLPEAPIDHSDAIAAVAIGAARCCELLEWESVIPIREE